MNKLAALTQFLIALDLIAPEQIDGWAEDMELIPRHEPRGDGGIILFERWYTAWIECERWPHRRIDPDILFAQVLLWLIEHDAERDPERGEDNPGIDVEMLNGDLATLSLTIRFREEVGIVPDDDGVIEFDGQRWSLDAPAVWAAEAGEVA